MAKNGGRNKRSKAKESKYKTDDQVNRTIGEDDPWDPIEAIESTVSNLERNRPSRKKDRFQTFFHTPYNHGENGSCFVNIGVMAVAIR